MRGALLVGSVLLFAGAACGEPIARGVPHPDNGAMAGAAAAIAGAATLAAPDAAAAKQEQKHDADVRDDRGVKVKETVPSATFDRLDAKQAPPPPTSAEAASAPAATPAKKKKGAPPHVPSPADAAAAATPEQ